VLDLSPSSIWRQNEPDLIGIVNVPQISWRYELPMHICTSTEEPINELLKILLPKKNILVPFLQGNNLDATIDVLICLSLYDLADCRILLELLPETAAVLADMNINFQITPCFHENCYNPFCTCPIN
jgi:hypothetical protein